MNTPKLALKPPFLMRSALAAIATLALWCGQAYAQITVLDQDSMPMTFLGGIGSYQNLASLLRSPQGQTCSWSC